ncbi:MULTISPECIES: Cro/CI family transcriptional regulator [Providencia]|uniref:Cro/CI family transcriptional regulator n=1 Tax=Providencia TaxID=586 RepID=UPI0023492408|nr:MULTISPECIES: Cro/CI family transcriptional regulator [Providencia]MDK7745190.1 Cro/CI family transcriptional regulator [Providencia rettgeri]MDK7757728.1 Cro/CI family transcriptional regulator [Providencia rettgeri]
MKRIPLIAFATEIGQNKAAEMLGVRQSAISKAILKKRNIYVIQKSDGTIEAEEIKSFPATKNE